MRTNVVAASPSPSLSSVTPVIDTPLFGFCDCTVTASGDRYVAVSVVLFVTDIVTDRFVVMETPSCSQPPNRFPSGAYCGAVALTFVPGTYILVNGVAPVPCPVLSTDTPVIVTPLFGFCDANVTTGPAIYW